MKRLVPVVAALTLVAAACGGGDDPTSEAPPADTAETTAEAPSTEATETSDEAETPNESDTSDDVDDSTNDAVTTDDAGDNEDDGGVSIQSIDDIPQECQDEMAEFLRALEPIVSPIDWQTATMADFEQIANDFEAEAEEFERATAAECDDLAFVDESEGEILVDFARSEAPGAVGFLEFLEQMRTGVTPDEDDTAAPAGIETCEDAIEFLQGLMDDYAAMSAVPASELVKIPSIAPLYAECTPEQLEFFDNPDLQEFMGG